jgi:gamma-glutamyltranspeptidase/glutathione hydrolase
MKRIFFIFLFGIIAIGAIFGAKKYGYFTPNITDLKKDSFVQSRSAPEAATGRTERREIRAQKHMVATANHHGSEAGLKVLKAGGSAMDAAIAAQLVLNVVEPQSSGIGGGAFLLHFDKTTSSLQTYDGRETAPKASTERLFLRDDGSALGFGEAVRSGRSIGVPGLIKMMELAHETHGKLPWADLFQPAIKLARSGFPVSKRLHNLLTRKGADFFNPAARALFFKSDGSAISVGETLKNLELADSFELIALRKSAGFYEGELAQAIIKTAKDAPVVASQLTLEDLSSYEAKLRTPICGLYLKHKVCGMGAPSSGGTTVAMILGLIEPLDLGKTMSADALHKIAEAEKLAFADRNHYMADADFVPQPKGFLSRDYLSKRRELIQPKTAIEKAKPGDVPLAEKASFGKDATIELGGTTHISIIDADGNAVSMTSSIEGAFGSGQMVGGFLLNNQLTDFSFKPMDKEGKPIANRVQPMKRPRSSMAPTIVFDENDDVRIVVGSPGGSRIILFVVKALVAHLNWGLGPQEAVSLLNFGSRNGPFELEKHTEDSILKSALEALGQKVRLADMTSGAQMIVIKNQELIGGADPRREGVVLGE